MNLKNEGNNKKELIDLFYKEVNEAKKNGEYVCSIWIDESEGFIDINVWDEMENERVESLEVYNFFSKDIATNAIERIIVQNPHIKFIKK